ncbi:MAG: hypothetical protein C5B49_11130 [Bdellovibrio sp.]|nr:MAG: hypothetical protein C5B49_11130 [Bdellovibrio sp.]
MTASCTAAQALAIASDREGTSFQALGQRHRREFPPHPCLQSSIASIFPSLKMDKKKFDFQYIQDKLK